MFVRDGSERIRCYRCGEEKSADEFAWRRRRRNQRDSFCRPCRSAYHREHYLANKQRYIEQAAVSKRKLILERTRYLLEFFAANPCKDCGESDPVVLEFDHRDPATKSFDVGNGLASHVWATVLAEIEKCDVVCANCHRKRHRRTSVRATLAAQMRSSS